MTFEKHGLYRHKNCREVDMFVKKIVSIRPFIELSIEWVNQYNPRITHGNDLVIIKESEYENWTQLTTSDLVFGVGIRPDESGSS